jgi:hypothetical protein
VDVASLLDWSGPREIPTRNGRKLLRTGRPGEPFWRAWRAAKEEMKALGVRVRKDEATGVFTASWWQDAPVEPSSVGGGREYEREDGDPEVQAAVRAGGGRSGGGPACQDPPQDALCGPGASRSAVPPPGAAEPAAACPGAGGAPGQAAAEEWASLPMVKQPVWQVPVPQGVIVPSSEQEAIFAWAKMEATAPKGGRCSLVVRARAGCGKTWTAKRMFGMAPERDMLYVIFAKRNQLEAKAKIDDNRVDVLTFNALGYRFVRQVWPEARPDDEVENDRVLAVVGEVAVAVRGAVKRLVGFAKNTTINPTVDELMDIADERMVECPEFEEEECGGWTARKLVEAAMKVLEASKVRDPQNRISFNDQLWLPMVMGWAHPMYDLVVVDECQDMNIPQLLMARKALRQGGRMCVIGDDFQAIFWFRGAASDGIDMMKRDLDAAELGLTVTRRCPKSVVRLAQRIVHDYQAAPDAPEGVVETVRESSIVATARPGDAILSRINAPLMSLCLQLLRRGTPARIEGKDIGKQLLGVIDRIKARSVPDFMGKLRAWADRQLRRFAKSKHFKQKADSIADTVEMLEAMAEGAANMAEISSRADRLFGDSSKDNRPAVVLSSVHRAKGLEWDKVYLLHRTFNRRTSFGGKPIDPQQAREEKNIYYVALTRAKRHLVLAEDGGGGVSRGEFGRMLDGTHGGKCEERN